MREFVPWEYQRKMIEFALVKGSCGLFVPMGMGKTSAALSIVKELVDFWGDVPVLVVAPLAVARSTWASECEKWENFKDIRVSLILGDRGQRERALKAKADMYVINYENLPWLVHHLHSRRITWPFPTVIADELTRLKSFRVRGGSQRARALATVRHRIKRFIGMTGTPAPNGLKDLWGQVYFIDRGERLRPTYTAFIAKWFTEYQVGNNPHAKQVIPRENADREIREALSDVCLSIKAEDYFDLDKPRFVTRFVDLDSASRALYKDMEKRLFVELSSGQVVEAVNAAAKTMKLLQLASGAIYTNESHDWETVHDAKLDELESIVEELNGEPVLVAYQFVSDRDRIAKRFKGLCTVFDGSREQVDAFNRKEIPMLLVHPASAGHGLSLQDGSATLVLFSQSWDLEQYLQVIERIGPMRQRQAGHPRVVTVFNIIARDTVDELALSAKGNKEQVQAKLMEYLRRKQNAKE